MTNLKKYTVNVPLIFGRGKTPHRRGDIVTANNFPEGNAAELEVEGRLVAIDDNPEYDSDKSMGVNVKLAKEHIATLNTVAEIDNYIDAAETRKGVNDAVTERMAEIDSQGNEGNEGDE